MFQNLVKDVQFEIMESGFGHADESETLIGLYTHPQFVDMSEAEKGDAKILISKEYYQGVSEAAVSKPCRFDEVTETAPEQDLVGAGHSGIFGVATIDTREKGEKYVKVIVERMAQFVNHIKERYPAGVKPLAVD